LINFGKHPILGVLISAVDYDYVAGEVIEAARMRIPLTVSALAVHGVMTGYLDISQRRRLNALHLVVPDGQPVRWALRWLHGVRLPDRVYGPKLTLQVVDAAARAGMPVYFYGSTEQTLRLLTGNLQRVFPHLMIAGAEPSKFRRISQSEKGAVVQRIRSSGARLVFLGLGCPRQEVWAYEYRDCLQMPILAVGAAFSFHAGVLPQAPTRMQNLGLEWLYRLFQEPRRLWKRYLYLNPLYLSCVILEALGVTTVPVLVPNGMEAEESYG